jgi:Protein of unknown function (DUF3485)
MISGRHAAAVAVLLALALIPTAIHSYWGVVVHDGRRASQVPANLEGMPSTPTARKAPWVMNNFQSDDWIERTYRAGSDDVVLFVGRSYDAKRLYHHPELALLRGYETAPAGTTYAERRPDIPLHLVTTERGGERGVAVYALLYDGTFIANPVAFQLKSSAELLVGGRKPMTLFMASDLVGARARATESPAARVLLAAIAAFEAQRPTADR